MNFQKSQPLMVAILERSIDLDQLMVTWYLTMAEEGRDPPPMREPDLFGEDDDDDDIFKSTTSQPVSSFVNLLLLIDDAEAMYT